MSYYRPPLPPHMVERLILWLGLALLVATAVGCGQPAAAEPRNAALVKGVEVYASWHTWKLTPWVRIAEDMTHAGAFYVVFSSDGRACLVNPQTWVLAKPGDLMACESGWRFPR